MWGRRMPDSLILRELLTIVIPCKNEEKYIGALLEDLVGQKGIDGVRIIVADANSSDSTRRVISMYNGWLNLHIIDGGTVSAGRNNGALVSTTPYVLFVDADVRFFNTHIIYDAVQCIHTKQLDLVGARPKNYGNDWRASVLFYLFGVFNDIFTKFTPFAVGAFFLTRRSTFNALGGFPNKYVTAEDYILSAKYPVNKFKIINHYFGQDERRFKKMGYWGMIRYMIINFWNRNNPVHFENTSVNYWN
jgi:glycosyltransferase involved in cell wall biosynthesis